MSYIILLGVSAALYPQAIQRIYAARSSQALRRSMAIMPFMPLTTAFFAVLAGVTAAAHLTGKLEGAGSDAVLGVLMRQVQEQGAFGHCLVVLIFAVVLGAIMSTADSALLSISSMVTKDLYAGFVRPNASQASLTRLGKRTSAVVVVAFSFLAIYMNNSGVKFTLVELLEMKFDLLLQIAPAFLIGLHWKGLRAGPVFVGMLSGLILALSFFWVDDKSATFMASLKNSGFHPGIWGLGLNTVIAVGGSLVIRSR